MSTFIRIHYVDYVGDFSEDHGVAFSTGLKTTLINPAKIEDIILDPVQNIQLMAAPDDGSGYDIQPAESGKRLPFSSKDIKIRIVLQNGGAYDLLLSVSDFEQVLKKAGGKIIDAPSGLPRTFAKAAGRSTRREAPMPPGTLRRLMDQPKASSAALWGRKSALTARHS